MKSILLIVLSIACLVLSAAAQQVPKTRWAKFGDVKIRYYDVGDRGKKDALVLVHGWTCNADFWRDSIAAFPGYRVIALDLPGHGQSDKPRTKYTMEYFARAVEAVMQKAKVRRAVLAGHSMGTPVVRQFYRLFPARTRGIVIVDGALRPYLNSDVFEKFFAPIRADYDRNAHVMIDGMLTPVKDEKRKAWIRSAMLATPGYVAISAMDDGMGEMKIWETEQIKVPVLAVMAQSPAWKPDEEQFFRSIAPDLEFQMWTGVSHFLMMDRPKEFNDTVAGFIAKKKLL
ncbi:MAG: alpha/beta fold hydrolase [Pyrinomonadaceae bacterium]